MVRRRERGTNGACEVWADLRLSTEQHERDSGRSVAGILSRRPRPCCCNLLESGIKKDSGSPVVSAAGLRTYVKVSLNN